MSTTTHSLLETIRSAMEARDAAALAALYAPDAEVTIMDRTTPPSSPRVLHGKGEVVAFLDETYEREMTHDVRDMIEGANGFAHTVYCRYPDGTRVICATIATLDGDGRIAQQVIVQAWDE